MRSARSSPGFRDPATTHPVRPTWQYAMLSVALVLFASLVWPGTSAAATVQTSLVRGRGVGVVTCAGTARLRILVTRVDGAAGTQKLKVKGEFDLGSPIEGGLDPLTSGFALAIHSAGGQPLLQVTVPVGAYSRESGEGWKLSAAGGKAQWKSRAGIEGVTRVKLAWDDATGQGSLDLRGQDLSLAVTEADLPLQAEVGLDAVPVADRCGVATEVDPEGECAFNASGSTLSCQIFGEPTPVNPCVSPVVWLRTGFGSSCGGQDTHAWPVGVAASDCHGWRALDNNGQPHDNSANDIRCNPDGSFSFVQFAGNLNCTGTGTAKAYVLNVCEQDIPPSLYTMAFDLTCCSAPADPACRAEVPSVNANGGSVFLNGAACLAE